MVTITNSINDQVGASNSGVTNTFTVTNLSDTANSAANVQVTVGGGTAADAYENFLVTGAGTFSIGIDNSDSDKLKITTGATPSAGTESMSINSAGTIVVGGGTPFGALIPELNIVKSNIAGGVGIEIQNTDTTDPASTANLSIRTSSTGGDPMITFGLEPGAANYSIGIDNSDSDKWKLVSNGGDLSTARQIMDVYLTGEVTFPLTSAFLAYPNPKIDNVTGDGTTYQVVYNTEVFDQNADYNNGTGAFTAPVTGRYRFTGAVQMNELAAGHTLGYVQIVTSNRTYSPNYQNPYVVSSGGIFSISANCLADMDAGDTAYIAFTVTGAAKAVDVGGTAPASFFCGELAC